MLLGTHFTDYGLAATVPPVQVGHREVDTSVLNGFPDSQQVRLRALLAGHPVGGFSWWPVKRVFLSGRTVVLTSSAASAPYRQVPGELVLALGEPVVPRRVWISSMKLPEFLQTAY